MRDIFNQELKQLGSDLETMARQVATAIERAAESLSNGDIIIAEQVIDADERINDLQRDGRGTWPATSPPSRADATPSRRFPSRSWA